MKNEMNKYDTLWLAFVNIEAMDGYNFNDLIDTSDCNDMIPQYIGAWANILVKADIINEAIDIIPLGLKEKKFKIRFIESVGNLQPIVEHKEITDAEIAEADWLLSSNYKFIIMDRIYPYITDEED